MRFSLFSYGVWMVWSSIIVPSHAQQCASLYVNGPANGTQQGAPARPTKRELQITSYTSRQASGTALYSWYTGGLR